MDSSISRVRATCSIAWAWRILGFPGKPAKDCKSPFRSENRASFSIYQAKDGERFFDHGDGSGGDVVDFVAKAKGVTVKEALATLCAMTGPEAPDRPPERVSEPKGIRWPPDIRMPLGDECHALATLRSLSPEAFFLAGRLGTLKVATVYGQKSWIITDCNARCAEARRFDGALFPNGKKGFCLPGSKKDLPLGLKTSNPAFDQLAQLLLVEGMPDYYAALQLSIESEISFRPIAILGASLTTLSDTQQYLAQKKILIICHNDPQGQVALPKWVKELYRLGAKSVVSQALPFLHDDLNDFLQSPGSDNPLDLLKGFQSNATRGRSIP